MNHSHSMMEIVKLLLRKEGVELNARNHLGMTPLMLALRNEEASSFSHRALAELFLKHPRLDMKCVDNSGKTALHHACVGSCVGVVRRLVNIAGVEVNAKDNDGMTPLMAAVVTATEQITEVLRLMVEVKGIDLDTRCPSQSLENKEFTLEDMARMG